jgi:hypothetical protein
MTDHLDTVRQDSLTGQLILPALKVPIQRADHAMGLELQIVELVERQARARVQHRDDDAQRFDGELAELQSELAATVDPGQLDL